MLFLTYKFFNDVGQYAWFKPALQFQWRKLKKCYKVKLLASPRYCIRQLFSEFPNQVFSSLNITRPLSPVDSDVMFVDGDYLFKLNLQSLYHFCLIATPTYMSCLGRFINDVGHHLSCPR